MDRHWAVRKVRRNWTSQVRKKRKVEGRNRKTGERACQRIEGGRRNDRVKDASLQYYKSTAESANTTLCTAFVWQKTAVYVDNLTRMSGSGKFAQVIPTILNLWRRLRFVMVHGMNATSRICQTVEAGCYAEATYMILQALGSSPMCQWLLETSDSSVPPTTDGEEAVNAVIGSSKVKSDHL